MSDLLADSNTWLEDQRHSYLTSPIEYVRGLESVSISATLGKTEYEVGQFEGDLLTEQTIDFIIRPEDLGVSLSEPEAGDKIKRTVGSKVLTYEVWTPSGDDLFAYDSQRLSMRIHTQLVLEEDA